MSAIQRRPISARALLPATGAALMFGLIVALADGCAARVANSNDERARNAFDSVRAVLQHPRCQNCHISGDVPLQLDTSLPHAQNVQRGPAGLGRDGMHCGTCHGEKNPPASYGLHIPPGAPNWRLPPPQVKVVFMGLGPQELCRSIKDPAQMGGKDLAGVLDYVAHDELVGWGWDPGPGRSTPPLTRTAFVQAFQDWMHAGAPCPRS